MDGGFGSAAGIQSGRVFVFYEMDASGASGGLTAVFFQTSSPQCHARTVGPCDVLRCDVPVGGSISSANASAGSITISGGSSPAVLTPDASGTYSLGPGVALPSYAPGASVGVAAVGGSIPAFSAKVTFAPPITVTKPAQAVIDRMSDLVLAWTGPMSASVLATIEEGVPDRIVRITCVFDGAGGSGTVPAAALTDLEVAPLGSGSSDGDLSIYSVGFERVSAGGFPVMVAAGSRAFSALPTIQ
jgi:hypothetical protein